MAAAGDSEPLIQPVWLGRAPYRETWELQEGLRRSVLDGTGGETLLLCEHDSVVTLGRGADPAHVLVSAEALGRRGIDCVRTSRGGDVTFHGPGQLVAYPIVRLDALRGVRRHVEAMAAAAIDVAAAWGIEAMWRPDRVGVWVQGGKLCAFGVHVHRRVAIHGMALNVTTALDFFSNIVPCGLRDARVTSIADLTGLWPPLLQVAEQLARALADRLGRLLPVGALPLRERSRDSLLSPSRSLE